MVVPVGPTCDEYAQRVSHNWEYQLSTSTNYQVIVSKLPTCPLQVQKEFHNGGLMTDVDLDPGCTLNKKIRNAQLAQYNFILGNLHNGFLYIIQFLFTIVSV